MLSKKTTELVCIDGNSVDAFKLEITKESVLFGAELEIRTLQILLDAFAEDSPIQVEYRGRCQQFVIVSIEREISPVGPTGCFYLRLAC